MRITTRWAARGMGGDNSRNPAVPKRSAGGGSVANVRSPVITPGLGGEIANLKDRASPATMRESQVAWLGGDGFDGACWWQGGLPGDSKHLTRHCALDIAVEAASITRKSTSTLMSNFFQYITHSPAEKLALDCLCL
jgi:hypothetical protein